MTDRVGLVRAEIKRLRKEVKDSIAELGNSESERIGLFKDLEIYDNILSFIDSMQKEPVSEDWRTAANVYVYENAKEEWSDCDMHNAFVAGAKWQKAQMDEYLKDMSNEIDLIGD